MRLMHNKWGVLCGLLLGFLSAAARAATPIISDPTAPVSVTNVLGDPFAFDITVANDDGTFNYRWLKGGAIIPTNTLGLTPHFSKAASTSGDGGTYTCRVYPSAGSTADSAPFYLTVLIPPVISSQPKDTTASQGDTATFTVKASTSYVPTNFTYQWMQDGFDVDGATNATLTLTNVQPDDEGDYSVAIDNGATTMSTSGLPTVSTNAHLTVVVPPTISFQPDDQNIELGDTAYFSVVLDPSTTDTEANPVTYRWRRYGVNIGPIPNPSATNANFELPDAQIVNQGIYTCEIKNSAGAIITDPATLWFVPVITDASETNYTVTAGADITLYSAATGTAPLAFQWLFNGQPIPGAASANYTVHVGGPAQAGDYSVIVTNIAGTDVSLPFTLTVLAETNPPTLTITSPANSSRFTNNPAITITGTASDNGQVNAVRYQLNAATNLLTATGTNSWQFTFTAVPGTNNYSVYAVDAYTNQSAVATRNIFYVVPALFTPTRSGLGSITTNWTGPNLEIGRSYTMTAVPASGYRFANWTGGVSATNTNLTFMMQTNLAIQANFVENIPPTLAITNPATNTRFTNTSVTVRGNISDNNLLTGFFWRLGTNVWTAAVPASLGPGTSTWSVAVNPAAGTNIFSAYAADIVGNLSATSSINVIYTGNFAPVISAVSRTSGTVRVDFPSVAGATYSLEYKNLFSAPTWTALAGSLVGTGGPLFLTDTNLPAGPRFYRLKGQP